ncbi:MAG: M28 family peptidase [Planctomycetota bacterium]
MPTMHNTARFRVPAILLTATMLTACGGGGGERAASLSATTTAPETSAADAIPYTPAEFARYMDHLTFLGDERLGGRLPGDPGIAEAEEYIRGVYRELGLEPAFTDNQGEPTYNQPFSLGSSTQVTAESLRVYGAEEVFDLEAGKDFNVLGVSGKGTAVGLVRFVGYSIATGPDGYNSYGPDNIDPVGEIAVITRFEPFDENGNSHWDDRAWSDLSDLNRKFAEAESRGVEAIVLVTPRGVNDPRVNHLEDFTTITGRKLSIPIVMVTADAMDRIIAAGVPQASNPPTIDRFVREHHVQVPRPIVMSGVTLSIEAAVEAVETIAVNTGAVFPGIGELADEYVVIGGHHDHIGTGQFGTRTPEARGQVHAGADDNASGTAAVLLAAEEVIEHFEGSSDPRRSVLFMTYSAEEQGLLGARHYMTDPIASPEDHAAMLNMDMIGRALDGSFEIHGVYTGEGFRDIVETALDERGARADVPEDVSTLFTRSDHYPYYQNDIPVLFAFSGNLHDDYHGIRDTLDKLNEEVAAGAAMVMADIAVELASRPEQLTFKEAEIPRRAAPRIRIGVQPMPSPDLDNPGMLISAVTPDGAADQAGIEIGDIVTRWGDIELSDTAAFWRAMMGANPGEEVELLVVRDGEEITLTLVPQAR